MAILARQIEVEENDVRARRGGEAAALPEEVKRSWVPYPPNSFQEGREYPLDKTLHERGGAVWGESKYPPSGVENSRGLDNKTLRKAPLGIDQLDGSPGRDTPPDEAANWRRDDDVFDAFD